MKPGEKFDVAAEDLLKPLIGTIATLTTDGTDVRVRIKSVQDFVATVVVVDDSTKE